MNRYRGCFSYIILLFYIGFGFTFCAQQKGEEETSGVRVITPDAITDTTLVDTDDPAIWIHPQDVMQSLILGTDKGDYNGGIYVFDIYGKLIPGRSILNLPRPNNVDVEYGFVLKEDTIDIAVFTLRNADMIRVVRLPDMSFIDGNGIPVFAGDSLRSPMGIGLYKKPDNGDISAIVSRKDGKDGSYLWQYALRDSMGVVVGQPIRMFGAFKGGKEIEAVAVDDAAGFVYYSDEGAGVRKYYAHPDSSNTELAFFGDTGFQEDHEGICIYPTGQETGYILVSDQQANRFQVFDRREPHARLAMIHTSTDQSDGCEVTAVPFAALYPRGFFVAMSDDRTFQIYSWEKLQQEIDQAVNE